MTAPQISTIPLARPCVGADELDELREVLASRTLARGPKIAQFEKMVADLVGAKHALATTSATTALHLSLVALGLKEGDEVLVPDFTFPATANVVVQQGCKPVLVDVDLDSFTMNIADLERRITPRSRAIMPVHAFGRAADMDAIMAVAKKHKLAVVEDAACSIGSAWKGRQTGGIGDIGCFSFHPRKVITTGEGGMITTNDDALADKMRVLRNHGGVRTDGRFVFEEAGFNYWMSDIQAAVGVAQMRKLAGMNTRRRAHAEALSRMLADVPGVRLPSAGGPGEHIFQSFIILLEPSVPRDGVIRTLRQLGVETTLGTYALHCQPYYQRAFGYQTGDLPNSRQAFERSLALPLFYEMEHTDLVRVAASLKAAIADAMKSTARSAKAA